MRGGRGSRDSGQGTGRPHGVAPYRERVLSTIRQPRYAALTALMAVVAAICIGAGIWQLTRLEQKITANDALRHNAHASTAQVQTVLPTGAPVKRDTVEFRTVTATGTYEPEHQVLVRHRNVNSTNGYLVLTPLRTSHATLLVVRGFVADTGTVPAVAGPPSGTVTVVGWVRPPESRSDKFAQLDGRQVESINPGEWTARLGTPVFSGYVELNDGQPGTNGLTPMPPPDLSNPAGGAVEPQHLAYVIQWFLFAALAMAAPFAMARADRKHAQQAISQGQQLDELDQVAAEPVSDPITDTERARAERLADRYGRSTKS